MCKIYVREIREAEMRVQLECKKKWGLRSRRGILICKSRGPSFEGLVGVSLRVRFHDSKYQSLRLYDFYIYYDDLIITVSLKTLRFDFRI
jgi:hypothetical protein